MGDKLLCLKSDCPDRWESVSEHFVLMKLRAEAHKLREERDALLAALEAAPFLEWNEFTPAGERENMLVEYDLWYNDECQAALGGGDD